LGAFFYHSLCETWTTWTRGSCGQGTKCRGRSRPLQRELRANCSVGFWFWFGLFLFYQQSYLPHPPSCPAKNPEEHPPRASLCPLRTSKISVVSITHPPTQKTKTNTMHVPWRRDCSGQQQTTAREGARPLVPGAARPRAAGARPVHRQPHQFPSSPPVCVSVSSNTSAKRVTGNKNGYPMHRVATYLSGSSCSRPTSHSVDLVSGASK